MVNDINDDINDDITVHDVNDDDMNDDINDDITRVNVAPSLGFMVNDMNDDTRQQTNKIKPQHSNRTYLKLLIQSGRLPDKTPSILYNEMHFAFLNFVQFKRN